MGPIPGENSFALCLTHDVDWDVSEQVWDKGRLFALADSLSVPTPETLAPASVSEVAAAAPGLTYRELLGQHPFLATEGHYLLVQEYVDGSTTATVVLASDGKIRTHFQEERVRTHPSSGGNSTLLRAREDPQMLAHAAEVIDAIAWTGPAMVEFMETPRGRTLPHRGQRPVLGTAPLRDQLRDGNLATPLSVLWASLVADTTFVSLRDPMPTLEAVRQAATPDGKTALERVAAVASTERRDEIDPRGGTR